MVHGLEKFKEYFENHKNQYVFIGGTACDILMDELGAPFRATKDLDIVLIIESLDISFGNTFWQFIEAGGYKHRQKSTGKNQFYRFSKPEDEDFPKMIELFSRKTNNFELKFNSSLTPIHIDESIVSLSAILLDDAYYDLLVRGKLIVEGYSLIEIETVILFKIKAWIDLKQRKKAGEQIDSKNIKKHRNDIFRLLVNVNPSTKVEIVDEIKDDVNEFIDMIHLDKPDLKNLGIKRTKFSELMESLKLCFL
jgi:hypothetical protein